MEFHDKRPVTRNRAWFRRKTFDVADATALADGRVKLWMVLGIARETTYARHHEDPDSKMRTTVIEIENVYPVRGELEEMAARFLDGGEHYGALRDQAADLELDRLYDYLHACWPNEVEEESESPVDAVIRLLDRGAHLGIAEEIDVPVRPTEEEYDALPVLVAEQPANSGLKVAHFVSETEGVEVPRGERVGSIYRRGSASRDTRDLIEGAFRDG